MNPEKAKMLATLDASARVHDASLHRSLSVAANPGQHGWRKSFLTAAVVVPLTGISAVLTDLSRAFIALSDDDAWGRQLPSPPSGGTNSDQTT